MIPPSPSQPDWLLYEHQVCRMHRNTTGHTVIHWSLISDTHLVDSGFVHSFNAARIARKTRGGKIGEYGLDALALDNAGTYHGLQMKLRTSTAYLRAEDIATFQSVMLNRLLRHNPQSRGFLYTNARLEANLRDDMLNGGVIHHVHLPPEETVHALSEDVPSFSPPVLDRDYQIQALKAILDPAWKGFGVLSMPCGTGKTLVFANAAKTFQKVVIISPTRVCAAQNLDVLHQVLAPRPCLLVDSDSSPEATRNVGTIRAFWNYEGACISTTFKSAMDVIKEAILEPGSLDKGCLVVVDEAHNMTPDLQSLLDQHCSSNKILLCTATPPKYLAAENTIWDNSVYHLSFADAIAAGWICDYEIRVPFIENGDDEIPELAAQARFLADGLMRTGARRTIVYCSSKKECDAFLKEFRSVMVDFHGIDADSVWCHRLTDEASASKRRKLLGDFQTSTEDGKVRVLASVRILDEAVDLPACDSICILHPSDKKEGSARFIQRMMRAGRKYASNPNKVAHVFLWLDGDHVPQCFDMLKEQDVDFYKKVRAQRDVYGEEDKDHNVERLREMEKKGTRQLQANVRVSALTRDEYKWVMVKSYIDYFKEHKKAPPQTYVTSSGLLPGRWINGVKAGNTKISEVQREAILEVDPKAFEKKKRVKRVKEEEKVRRHLKYYTENKEWPTQNYVSEDGWKHGNWWGRVKSGQTSISDTHREAILAVDPRALELRTPAAFEKKRVEEEEKVRRHLKYYEVHKEWPTRKYVSGDGWKHGSWWGRVKDGQTSITDTHREAILAVDPRALKLVTPAAFEKKRVKEEERIQRHLKYFAENKKWPAKRYVDQNGWKHGSWWNRVKLGSQCVNESHHKAILAVDPKAFHKRKSPSSSSTTPVRETKRIRR